MLIGEDGVNRLRQSSVIIFGVGGVGSYVTEGLCKSRDRQHNRSR